MRQESSTFDGTADWSAVRQRTVKQRTAVQREVVRLLDDLAPERPPPRADAHGAGVRAYRWPGRCILQGDARAVSVSWFPGSADEHSLGEVLVIAWNGTVSLPGSARRAGEQAEAVTSLVLHPVEAEEGRWTWEAEDGDTSLATGALAAYCREWLPS